MKYPLDFIDAVLMQFPEYSYLQKMFERGDPIGRFLDDQIAYLTTLDFDDMARTFHINRSEVNRDLIKIQKLHNRYLEIAARQQDYAKLTPFRSIPVR